MTAPQGPHPCGLLHPLPVLAATSWLAACHADLVMSLPVLALTLDRLVLCPRKVWNGDLMMSLPLGKLLIASRSTWNKRQVCGGPCLRPVSRQAPVHRLCGVPLLGSCSSSAICLTGKSEWMSLPSATPRACVDDIREVKCIGPSRVCSPRSRPGWPRNPVGILDRRGDRYGVC